MDAGKLVPDQVITGLVEEFLRNAKGGCLLDGFPRTLPQARALDQMLAKLGEKLDYVVEVRTDPELIVSRLAQRLVCTSCGAPYHAQSKPPRQEGKCDGCGGKVERRADDAPETIRRRLAEYQEKTAPLVAYYREKGILFTVDGNLARAETYQQIKSKLGDAGE
jgi:adenylate kinase